MKLDALYFSPPPFRPGDNQTRTFRPMEVASKKLLVLVTFIPQNEFYVCLSLPKTIIGPLKTWMDVWKSKDVRVF
jgi:hypothetical protein